MVAFLLLPVVLACIGTLVAALPQRVVLFDRMVPVGWEKTFHPDSDAKFGTIEVGQ